MSNLVFAVDLGTSSLKAALIDSKGFVLNQTRIKFPQTKRKAIHWLEAFASAWEKIAGNNVAAIAISGNGPSLVSLDKNDHPSAIYLWNEPLPKLDAIAQLNVLPKTNSIFIPRLQAFKTLYKNEIDVASSVLSGPEFLIFALTGEKITILPNDRFEENYWQKKDLDKIQFNESLLPPFVLRGKCVGETMGSNAGLISLANGLDAIPKNIPVIAGGPDFSVALIGTGTITPGKACDRAGTSEGLNVCVESKLEIDGLRSLPSVISPFWNISSILPDTGQVFHNWRKTSTKKDLSYIEIMEEIYKTPISPTNYNDDLNGVGVVEKIGFSVRRSMDNLESSVGFSPLYVLSGGQARNEIWSQMKANITGRNLALTLTPDAELMGNAILAFENLGFFSSIEDGVKNLVKIKKVFEPEKDKLEMYTEKFGNL